MVNKNLNNIEKLIGNTPMIKIKAKYQRKIINVYVKLEYYNFTGSIKDRLAYYLIKDAYKNKEIKKHMPIIEATSGNTGISFAALGAFFNNPVHIFMPEWVSKERIDILKMYGAKVYLVKKEDGGFKESIKRANQLAKKIKGYRPNQFDNVKNVLIHYNTTGMEIINQLEKIDGFVSGTGTGGTLMGVAKRLKENNENIKIYAIEPKQLAILSKGEINGRHRIEGIGDDFIPKIVDKHIIDNVITIDDEDALNMSKIFARKFGLGVGISSGANFLGAILAGKNKENIVTIFADDLKKYLSTDLTKDINKNKNLISNKIKIISIEDI